MIITDYEMPQMCGNEFCWIVRQKRELARIPFFMVSSHHQNEMILACFMWYVNPATINHSGNSEVLS